MESATKISILMHIEQGLYQQASMYSYCIIMRTLNTIILQMKQTGRSKLWETSELKICLSWTLRRTSYKLQHIGRICGSRRKRLIMVASFRGSMRAVPIYRIDCKMHVLLVTRSGSQTGNLPQMRGHLSQLPGHRTNLSSIATVRLASPGFRELLTPTSF